MSCPEDSGTKHYKTLQRHVILQYFLQHPMGTEHRSMFLLSQDRNSGHLVEVTKFPETEERVVWVIRHLELTCLLPLADYTKKSFSSWKSSGLLARHLCPNVYKTSFTATCCYRSLVPYTFTHELMSMFLNERVLKPVPFLPAVTYLSLLLLHFPVFHFQKPLKCGSAISNTITNL